MTRASSRAEGRSTIGKDNRATEVAREPCFVLEISQRAVLAFSASSLRAAQARVQDAWFVAELEGMRSGGRPLLGPDDARAVRPALPAEIAAVELGRGFDEARGEDAKYGFAFLVRIDVPPN